jgi:serine/threonine-protein kinase
MGKGRTETPVERSEDAEPESPDFAPGTILDARYRVIDILGEGGVGIVYHAEHIAVGRHVAIKVLQRRYTTHALLRPRFEREAKALAALTHPNIVAISDYGMVDGNPYVVMEMLTGRTLREAIDQDGPFAPTKALHIAQQLLRGLAYAHAHGLVHRDIKPGNVFLCPLPHQPDMVKLLDFGFAKFLEGWDRDANENISQVGQAFGTPSYLPPEQATGAQTDARTDLYAAAVIVFEMLTGEKPFKGSLPEIIRAHLTAPVPSVRSLRPSLTEAATFDRIIARAMAKRPDDRFANAEELLAAIEEVQARLLRPRERRRGLFVAVALVALLGGLGASWAATRDPMADLRALAGEPATTIVNAGSALHAAGVDSVEPAADPPPEHDEETERADEPMVLSPEEAAGLPPDADGSLWDREPTPELVSRVRAQLDAGGTPSQQELTQLHRLSSELRSDPRPNLVLGRAYFARGWYSDALRRYESAFEKDPRVRSDPHMLLHLLQILQAGQDLDLIAADVIVRAYGDRANEAIEGELADPELTRDAERRLRHLQRQIARAR